MKIVFSRKGFDGGTGGVPSPIIDGVPISLPIPWERGHIKFEDLRDPIPKLVTDLTGRFRRNSTGRTGQFTGADFCHLDPDLDASMRRVGRVAGWRGALGQVGASQSHLRKRGVCKGDLMLFWGSFRRVSKVAGKWGYEAAAREVHMIFGWLQIGAVEPVEGDGAALRLAHPWLRDHSHLNGEWGRPRKDVIYIADESLSLLPHLNLAGSGVLSRGHELTAPGHTKSVWHVPDWLHPARGGCGMSYHPNPDRWLNGNIVRTVGRGQEFVADVGETKDALAWVKDIVAAGQPQKPHHGNPVN
jgi:hypothetical protein